MRIIWAGLGWIALGHGIAGILLPLLPTTPFLLLAAYCFGRSSPRLHNWLVQHPRLGPAIRDWTEEGAISVRAKRWAIAVILITFSISVLLQLVWWALLAQGLVLGAVSLFLLSRPTPTADRAGQNRRNGKTNGNLTMAGEATNQTPAPAGWRRGYAADCKSV